MHIPTSNTQAIKVLRFDEALVSENHNSIGYDPDKWLYVPNFYSEYRYILGTKGEKPLICIGINPSTAVPDNLDNTLKSVQRIATRNGFDSFIMFNVYAQRATNPDDMEDEFNPILHVENMKAFEYILQLSGSHQPAIWAAWGTIIEKRSYLSRCVADMIALGKKYSAKWYTAGKRSRIKGHPHHPLYLSKDSLIEPFDVEQYVFQIRSGGEKNV